MLNISKETIEIVVDRHVFTNNSAVTVHDIASLLFPKPLTAQELIELLNQQNPRAQVAQLGNPTHPFNDFCLEGTGQMVNCGQLRAELLKLVDQNDYTKKVFFRNPSGLHYIVGLCHSYWVLEHSEG